MVVNQFIAGFVVGGLFAIIAAWALIEWWLLIQFRRIRKDKKPELVLLEDYTKVGRRKWKG